MKNLMYIQCTLRCGNQGGVTRLVTWLPETHKGVKIEPGVQVSLKHHGSNENMEGIWTVETAGTIKVSEARVKQRAHKWRHYRANTDI